MAGKAFVYKADIFSQEDISMIQQMVTDTVATTTQGQTQGSFLQMLQMAEEFLLNYQNYKKNEAIAQEMSTNELKKQLTPDNSDLNEEFWARRRPKAENFAYQKLLQSAFRFNRSVHNFVYGEMPREAIFAFISDGQINSITMSMEKIATFFGVDQRLQNISEKQLKDNLNLNQNSVEKKINKQRMRNARQAYQALVARSNRYFEVFYQSRFKVKSKRSNKNVDVPYNLRQKFLLMWKDSANSWKAAQINNFGTVKEAYIAYLMDEHNSPLDRIPYKSGDQYRAHPFVESFFYQYLSQVDNKPAAFGEDIFNSKRGEFAVKGSSAHAPEMGPYYDLAHRLIAAAKRATNKEDIKKELQKYIDAGKIKEYTKQAILLNKEIGQVFRDESEANYFRMAKRSSDGFVSIYDSVFGPRF